MTPAQRWRKALSCQRDFTRSKPWLHVPIRAVIAWRPHGEWERWQANFQSWKAMIEAK